MLTNAERQRRSRAHRSGDHSLCEATRCTAGANLETPAAIALGPRGRQLWSDLTKTAPTPAARVLIEEACRIADRLDSLDRILSGEGDWLRLDVGADGVVVVTMNAPLAEARQQATALKQILAELRQSTGRVVESGAGGSIIDQLAARREQRLADAARS